MAHACAVEAEPLPACLYSIPVTPYYQYLNDAANGFRGRLSGMLKSSPQYLCNLTPQLV